jgi:predicted nucleotidyltransferase
MATTAEGPRTIDPTARDAVVAGLHAALAAEPRVRWAYLFGSLARGEPFRDVDVAVAVIPGAFPSLPSLGSLSRALAAATGIEGVTVDLFDVERCPLPMIDEVLRDGVVLHDTCPAERRLWEAEVNLRWLDFKPTWEAQRPPRARPTR